MAFAVVYLPYLPEQALTAMSIFIGFFKNKKVQTILAPLLKLCEAVLELFVPIVVAQIIDVGLPSGDASFIWGRCAILVALGVAGLCFSVSSQYMSAVSATGFASSLRRALYAKINELSFADLDKAGAASIVTRMTGDVDRLQTGVNMGLRLFLRSPFVVFGAVIMAFCVDAISATVFAVVVPLLAVVVFVILISGIGLYKKSQSGLENVTLLTSENVTGVRVLRAFAKEEEENERFSGANGAYTKAQLVAGRVSALLNPLTYVIINAAIIALLFVAGERVNTGALTKGQAVALYNYLSQILVELIKFANLIITVSRAGASGKRVGELLKTPPLQSFTDKAVKPVVSDVALRFENVSLRYGDGANALENVSFEVKKGEIFGIIGGTGSGKSSLLNLIPRFYDATDGSVSVEGVNVNEYPKKQLRDKIAIVMQKPFLLTDTVKNNICFGDCDEGRLNEAIEVSQCADVIERKKNGIEEKVLRGGSNFSGGQKQRLSIARALYKDADILLMDDASSALDNITERKLREGIARLGKTVVMTSQRTSGLQCADRILVLDEGKAVACGTHEELLEKCALYREIYELQNVGSGGER